MSSVRFRLLIMALLPLIVLMPLLLLLGMTRWSADYDKVLIANVESDLRIAEQYLARLMFETGTDLLSVSESSEFSTLLDRPDTAQEAYFTAKQDVLELDFLYFLPRADAEEKAKKWPVIRAALNGMTNTQIDIFGQEDLSEYSNDLAAQARIDLIETEAAVPTDRIVEDRGMVLHSASPVMIPGHSGVLVGGILLNRNLQFIDTINALVYLNAITGGERQGTATLFLDDVRVSTNVRLFEDVRALGTRVSGAVRGEVLDKGQTWLARAFVVNDWYISGYLPLKDSFGQRVGMLYVGFLEAPFSAAKRAAYLWMMVAFVAVLVLSGPLFLWLAKGIFAPLEQMSSTMRKVEKGDLSARNGNVGARDEIGQVAAHLDSLLNQVQDRDQKLRAWAGELNDRVDQRTSELRDANAKLEQTFKQLVMSEKLASIGEITAGVAHEINNPVAVIQGNVDVMRETLGENAECVKTELDLVDRQVSRIDAIVGKLLQFARPGEFSGFDESTLISPVVTDCLVLVDHLISKRNIEIKLDLNEAPAVKIDPGEMQQVVINLVVNAVQAMGDNGVLTISLNQMDQDGQTGAALVIKDTGPGIPLDKLNSVFDPFFTTKQAEGTGLGLSISQSLIQRAGGLISARNTGDGAEFTVWLPEAS
ncbi:Sensor protein ZraS [Pelagimonas phthalicica]|uniref:histidine kinase n=1 Tax=Pelagimonas phthalicica TaxID=1037362 RepID=A0A238J684_9RHOB|nr:HAMP domain-containing sensor histidine kinase [Pelagimonas phthalicica]TDS95205.1 two-component system NtrC family sensor kinase [Pelagimonas phthalicica]SMX26271.1 Sensor protein ZraS [Pelagimonas phthalicica]